MLLEPSEVGGGCSGNEGEKTPEAGRGSGAQLQAVSFGTRLDMPLCLFLRRVYVLLQM